MSFEDDLNFGDRAEAGLVANTRFAAAVGVQAHYEFECVAPDGEVRWRDGFTNLITNEGLDDLLSKYLKGSSYTATWYVGLVDNANFTSFASGDTAAGITLDASGGNSWQEFDDYSESNRQTWTGGSVSSQSVDNSGSKAAFSIDATGTVKGAFTISDNTIGGTSGVLLSEGAFSSARSVENGDTLNVTVTFTSSSQ